MIPHFGVVAGSVYIALVVAGVITFAGRRYRRAAPRIWFAAMWLAAALAVNAITGKDWLNAGIWAFNVALAVSNVRTTRRTVEMERPFERKFGARL